MVWYIFRHNVAETYIPNGGEEICSVAHGRRASSEQSKSSAADLVISPAFRLSPVRLDSPPARSLATGIPPGGMASSAAAITLLRPAPPAWHIVLAMSQPGMELWGGAGLGLPGDDKKRDGWEGIKHAGVSSSGQSGMSSSGKSGMPSSSGMSSESSR
jgi:hypothetical protein